MMSKESVVVSRIDMLPKELVENKLDLMKLITVQHNATIIALLRYVGRYAVTAIIRINFIQHQLL